MNGKSKKNIEVEKYVDDHTAEHGYPPTYKMIENKFNIGASAAHGRCAKFRHKMKFTKQDYTERDIIAFGNYLLSDFRKKNTSEINKHCVTDADFKNYKELTK